MKISEIIAKEFHRSYERLAPNFDYKTRNESRTEWENVPKNNRELMMAVVDDLLLTRVIFTGDTTLKILSMEMDKNED